MSSFIFSENSSVGDRLAARGGTISLDERVDLVLQTDQFIYVMEFKLNGTAEEALRQINDKHYAQPFEADGRRLFKIGVNFSAKTRNIERWLVE